MAITKVEIYFNKLRLAEGAQLPNDTFLTCFFKYFVPECLNLRYFKIFFQYSQIIVFHNKHQLIYFLICPTALSIYVTINMPPIRSAIAEWKRFRRYLIVNHESSRARTG